MAEFINFEAKSEFVDINSSEDDETNNDALSEIFFVYDNEINTSVNFYRQFTNVENDLNQVLTETHNEAIEDIEQFDEISNLNDGSDNQMEIDEFNESKIDIEKFNKTLFPKESENNENQFCKVVLYAIKFAINGTKNTCSEEDFEKVIEKKLVEEINQPEKFKFIIELQAFLNMCYEINMILSKFGYFLRVFELKNKFRHLSVKDKNQQKIVRQLSSYLIEKYNGFTIISIEYQKKQRKKAFKAIDIIYKPTKHVEIEPLCYFSEDISKAYSSFHSKGDKKGLTRAHRVHQCYYCNYFFYI